MILFSAIASAVSVSDEDNINNPDRLARDLIEATHLTLRDGENAVSDEALEVEVKRLASVAPIFGTIALSFFCVLGDLTGAIGGGYAILATSDILYRIHHAWERDRAIKKDKKR
jgi:preprotein translocase subunit SecY